MTRQPKNDSPDAQHRARRNVTRRLLLIAVAIRPFRSIVIRALAALTLLLVGMLGAGMLGYRVGTQDWLMLSDRSSDLPKTTSGAGSTVEPPRARAYSQFTESYRTLPTELRSTHPGEPRTVTPTPTSHLAGSRGK